MKKISHILVDMDPTVDYQPALYKAISLGKKSNAVIELFVACYNSAIVSNCFLDEDRLKAAIASYLKTKIRWLEGYCSEVSDAGLEVKVDASWHKPLYEGIIQKAQQVNADMVFKSTHKHGILTKIFFTPNDWQMLKSCGRPLWLAKSKSKREVKNILVAVDPTKSNGKPEGLDKKLLDAGMTLAKMYQANIHVAHCYEPLGFEMFKELGEGFGGFGESIGDHEEYVKSIEKQHRSQMEQITASFKIDNEHKYLLQGYPDICLPELVEMKEIDLIVIGTTYRTGLIGSTAEQILDKVSCDIFAVKPDAFESPVKS